MHDTQTVPTQYAPTEDESDQGVCITITSTFCIRQASHSVGRKGVTTVSLDIERIST